MKSNTSKIVIAAVLIILVAGVAWWAYDAQKNNNEYGAAATNAATTTQSANGMSAATDTSDTAMTQDMNSINTQMNDLNSDNANADAGLNASGSTQ